MSPRGKVYIVGAGPGDPELITVKGLRLLQNAQVVLYDHLVNREILREAPESAELIYVGKTAGHHSMAQEKINALLVEKVALGCMVVRLKGGDPFVFGRVGEEMDHLKAKGIPYEVVPGVTSASALAARGRFSLTHRSFSSTLTFVTGHRRNNAPLDLPFRHLSGMGGTLVVYMGLGALRELQSRLLEEGMAPSTPVLMGRRVSWPEERLLPTTLERMVDLRDEECLKSPVLVVIGDVVKTASLEFNSTGGETG